MTWQEAWERMDPERVLERKQEQQERRKKSRKQMALAGLEALFEDIGMDQDQSQQIEGLLQTWHDYEDAYRPALGAPRVSVSCREYRTGDMHDTADDDRDALLAKITAEAVGACVDELHYLQRAAIGIHFRNKYAGISVHRNPRIEDQNKAYREAMEALLPKLKQKGLVQ